MERSASAREGEDRPTGAVGIEPEMKGSELADPDADARASPRQVGDSLGSRTITSIECTVAVELVTASEAITSLQEAIVSAASATGRRWTVSRRRCPDALHTPRSHPASPSIPLLTVGRKTSVSTLAEISPPITVRASG